jgi:Bacterial Ig domain/Dockerin type I domain
MRWFKWLTKQMRRRIRLQERSSPRRFRRLIVEQYEERRVLAAAVNDEYTVAANQTLTVESGGRWANDTYNASWNVGEYQYLLHDVYDNPVWYEGYWENPVLQSGYWENPVWYDGYWENPVWYPGYNDENEEWHDGYWAPPEPVWHADGYWSPPEPVCHDCIWVPPEPVWHPGYFQPPEPVWLYSYYNWQWVITATYYAHETILSNPANGTLTQLGGGNFTYSPNANFTGSDTFIYQLTDDNGSSTATVMIVVLGNTPPVANNDAYTTDEDTPLIISAAAGLLANDSDLNGDPLTAYAGGPMYGAIAANPDGSFTYTPSPNFHGTDSFVYTISDGHRTCQAMVTITVQTVNDPPVATNDLYFLDLDAASELVISGSASVLSNDHDVDGNTIAASILIPPTYGYLNFQADGSFTYTPHPSFHGSDSFIYQASDGIATSSATAVIKVGHFPIANNDFYSISGQTLTIGSSGGVLANDSDVDGDSLSAMVVSSPPHGDLLMNSDGSFSYDPDEGFSGVDKFIYRVTDGTFVTTAESTITIKAPNAPASASGGIPDTMGAVGPEYVVELLNTTYSVYDKASPTIPLTRIDSDEFWSKALVRDQRSNEVQRLSFDFFGGVSLKLSYGSLQSNVVVNGNDPVATEANLQAALHKMFGLGNVKVLSTTHSRQFDIVFQGELAGADMRPLTVTSSQVQRLTITGSPVGSDFQLTLPFSSGSIITGSITYVQGNPPQTAVNISSALQQLLGLSSLSVLSTPNNVFYVTFANDEMPLMTSDDSAVVANKVADRDSNEVQRITFGEQPTGGSFTLTFPTATGMITTAQIPFSTTAASTAANIQHALNAPGALGPGDTIVVAVSSTQFDVTFVGRTATANQAAMTASGNRLAGGTNPTVSVTTLSDGGLSGLAITTMTHGNGNEIQRIVFDGTITGGAFRIGCDGVDPQLVAWQSNPALLRSGIQRALDNSYGTFGTSLVKGNARVIQISPQEYDVIIQNELAGVDLPSIVVFNGLTGGSARAVDVRDGTGNEVQRLDFQGSIDEGEFSLAYGPLLSAQVAWNSEPRMRVANVQTALDQMFGPGNTKAYSRSESQIDIVFRGQLSGVDLLPLVAISDLDGGSVALIEVANGAGNEVQRLVFSDTTSQTTGNIVLSYGPLATQSVTIAWNPSPASLRTAIESQLTSATMFGAGSVRVLNSAPNQFDVLFVGSLAGSNLLSLKATETLSPGTVRLPTAMDGYGSESQILRFNVISSIADGTTFTLRLGFNRTAQLTYNANADLLRENLQAALNSILGQGNVQVLSNGPSQFTVFVGGELTGTNVANLTVVGLRTGIDISIEPLSDPEILVRSVVDPRIIYDLRSGRWFAIAMDRIRGPAQTPFFARSILVAVSNSSEPHEGWSAFRTDPDPYDLYRPDFPRLGVDADGVYAAIAMFGQGGAGGTTTVMSIPKTDLLAPEPSIDHKTVHALLNDVPWGQGSQPVVDFFSPPNGIAEVFAWGEESRYLMFNLAGSGPSTFSGVQPLSGVFSQAKRLEFFGDISGGTVTFSAGTRPPQTLQWIADYEQLLIRAQDALGTMFGIGNVAIVRPLNFNPAAPTYEIRFANAIGSGFINLVATSNLEGGIARVMSFLVASPLHSELQRITFGGQINGGTFTLSIAGATAQTVDWNSGPAALVTNLQNALDAMFGVGMAAITNVAEKQFDISFGGTLTKVDLDQITVNASGLVGTNVTASLATHVDGSYLPPPASPQPGPDLFPSHLSLNGTTIYKEGNSTWLVAGTDVNGKAGLRVARFEGARLVEAHNVGHASLNLYYPSIAVNPAGDVVVGFSGSSATQFPSAYYIVGRTIDGVMVFGDVTLSQTGNGTFVGRWGDYSATVIDPNDPYVFWTFQEYTHQQNIWAINIKRVDVPPPSNRPNALNDIHQTYEDTPLMVNGSGILANDTAGGPLIARLVREPAHGVLTLQENGDFVYTPEANFSGVDSFTYWAIEGTKVSKTATVTITVNAVNDSPSSRDTITSARENNAYAFTVADFCVCDLVDSPSNGLATVKVLTLPGSGAFVNNGNQVVANQEISVSDINSGSFRFIPTPSSGTSSSTSFSFRIRDSGGTANGGIDLDPTSRKLTINVRGNPWHNYVSHLDVNRDGHIVAGDALQVINWINAFGSGPVPLDAAVGPLYSDVNNNWFVSPADVLEIINFINAFGPTQGEGEAGPPPASVWHNAVNQADVTGDGAVAPGDELAIINYLNAFGEGPVPAGASSSPPYYDVNNDSYVTALDRILVRNVVSGNTHLWRNPLNAYDVNADGTVTLQDYNLIDAYFDYFSEGPVPAGSPRGPFFYDANGDDEITADDMDLLWSYLNPG